MTKDIKLVSGIPATITFFTGKERRILTEKNGIAPTDRLYHLLANCTLQLGDIDVQALSDKPDPKRYNKIPRIEIFRELIDPDVRKLAVEIRMFTVDDPEFSFPFTYVGRNKVTNEEEEITDIVTEDLSEGFPEIPMKQFKPELVNGLTVRQVYNLATAKDNEKNPLLQNVAVSTLAELELWKDMVFTLPKSGRTIQITALDGNSNMGIDPNNTSYNILILQRQPKYMDKGTPIRLLVADVERMHPVDQDMIMAVANVFEGKIATETKFKHPLADELPDEQKFVIKNLLGIPNFFLTAVAQ